MSDTPETDDIARGNHVVPTEWAQQLERERDEAMEEIKEWKTLCLWGGTPEHIHGFIRGQQSRIQHLERERDEAREKVEQQRKEIVRLNGATNHAGGTPLKIALMERDEAREELHDIRLNLGEDADGYTLLHAVCVLQNKRDEAREEVKLLKAILDLIKKDVS